MVGALLLAVPAAAQTISFINLDPEVGAGLQIGTARARLSDSQHGGLNVRIESADSLVALISPTGSIGGTPYVDVFVPNGDDDALFWVQGLEDTTGTVDIIATASGFAPETTAVQVSQPAVEVLNLGLTRDLYGGEDPFRVEVGLPSGSSVNPAQQVRAGGLGLVATLTNSVSGVARLVTLPDTAQTVTVTIDPGSSTSAGTVGSGGVAIDPLGVGFTTISATIPGFIATDNATRDVEITQPFLSSGAPGVVGAGLRENGEPINFSGPHHGGVLLHAESSDSNLVLVSLDPNEPGAGSVDLFVEDGDASSTFYIHGKEDTTGSATITFSAPGFTGSQETATVVTPAVTTYIFDANIDVLDPLKSVRARVGPPNGGMTSISPAQQRRPGAPPLVVTVDSSDPSVVNFQTLTDTSGTVMTEIAAGSTTSPSGVAQGGVEMDGLMAGTSTVSLTIPGFIQTSGATPLVTVTQPEITVGSIEDVGAGLRTGGEFVNLSASQHGGVTVTLTSLNPDLALLSPVANGVVGTESIEIIFDPNDTSESFYVHGLEDTTGTAIIVASEPMFFSPDTNTVDVVMPAVSISALATTFDTLDPTEDFTVRTGTPHVSLDYIDDPQDVRPGSGGLWVTVTSSDSSVAELLTLADTSGTVLVLIEEDDDASGSNVGNGGIGANGLSPGMTTISAVADGFLSVTNAVREVTVTAPTMSLSVTDIGAGLQTETRYGQLSASSHPGVTVRVSSLDSALVLVSPGEGVEGAAFADIFVAPGQTSFPYVLQALEDTVGATGIVSEAPFFLPDTASVDVVQPGVEIASLATNIDASDPSDAFRAILGKPNAGNSDISSSNEQAVRAGSPGVLVTFTTTDSTVSRLVKTGESGPQISLLIPPGESRTPSSLVTGGVAHNGLAEGSTVVSAAAPGFISVATAFETVFITDQNLYLLGLPLDIGSGLQTGALTAQLGESSHGGLTMRIESSDSTLVRISTASGVAGDSFIEVLVPNGTTDVNYFLHGQSGVTGPAVITATAAEFASSPDTAYVVPPVVGVIALADSIDVADSPDEFIVQIGVPDAGGTAIATPQRAGSGLPLDLMVVFGDSTVGELETMTTQNDTVMVQIPAGESQTQGTVAAGGVAFVPLGPGTDTVTPIIAGFTSLPHVILVTGTVTGVAEAPGTLPMMLAQNVPNPVSSATRIRFTLPAASPVSLEVYDVAGRRVKTLLDRSMPAGAFEAVWDGRDDRGLRVSSGVYFYRLVAGNETHTRRLILLR